MRTSLAAAALVACGSPPRFPGDLPSGVVLAYPRDHQRDVPLGAHLTVSFSDPIIPACIVLTRASFEGLLKQLKSRSKPTQKLRKLMRGQPISEDGLY